MTPEQESQLNFLNEQYSYPIHFVEGCVVFTFQGRSFLLFPDGSYQVAQLGTKHLKPGVPA